MTDILTAAEVADYFRVSLSSLKRWVLLTRRGSFDFPMPISPKGGQLRWRKTEIEVWGSRIGNIPMQPTSIPTDTPAERKRREYQVATRLEKLGITVHSNKEEI
jgi:predicted DNA-binding transcriptional regulator AlpA